MFDIFTEKLGYMQSIQFKLYATYKEKPFEHLDPSTHDVFLISNSLHFTLQESQQLLKKMELLPAPFLICKVLHYETQQSNAAGFSYLEEDYKNESTRVITSSLFLVTAKEDSHMVLPAFRELGFMSGVIPGKHYKDIIVLEAFNSNAFTVDGIRTE